MKSNESILKNICKIISIICLLLLIVTIIMDVTNITQYKLFKNISRNYDWMGLISAIIGGLVGSIGTLYGILITIKNERESNLKKEQEERKRNGYSYISLTKEPLSLIVSLDSVRTNLNVEDENRNIVIAENVKLEGSNYLDIELNFNNINNNLPSEAKIEKIYLKFNSEIKNNKKHYKDIIFLSSYSTKFKPLTITNNSVFALPCLALINKDQLKLMKDNLIKSEFVDIIAIVNVKNANGIVTKGTFSGNLIKDNETKFGNENILGSNKIRLDYKAENTYVTINDIKCMDNNQIEED